MAENKKQLTFESEFAETLITTQEEANRLDNYYVSTLNVIKTLIYDPSSYMYEYIDCIGGDWGRIDTIIEKFENREKKLRLDSTIPIYIESIEGETIQVNLEQNLYTLLYKSMNILIDQEKTIGEIVFVLSVLDNETPRDVVSFFNQIGVNIVIMERYYLGIFAQIVAESFSNNQSQDVEEYLSEQYEKELEDNQEETLMEEDEFVDDYEDSDEKFKSDEKDGGVKKVKKIKKTIVIPEKLKGCLEVMQVDTSKENVILGRDDETERLIKALLKHKKSNAILIGNPGVGKTAIVESLVYKINSGDCVETLKNKVVLSFNVNEIISGTMLRGMLENKLKILLKFLEKTPNIILFMDEIHTIIGAGQGTNDSLDLANSLKPILAREGISVIGATTIDEYQRCFSRDTAFRRRFETIIVKEPEFDEIYPMIKKQVEKLSKDHGVLIPKSVVEYAIRVAPCFNSETCNPDCSLDLIDKALVTAKMMGKQSVTKEVVLKNFDANFKLYNEMDEEMKKSIAYHEAGHYLVNRYAKNISKNRALAVSIIPVEGYNGNYLGLSVTDNSNTNIIDWNYEANIEEIAVSLGGRVAEKMYTGTLTSGASDDLRKATRRARKMLVEDALVESFSKRNYEKDMDRKTKTKLNNEIDKIIEEANKMASKILEEHKDVLEEVVNKLIKDRIVMGPDLEKICERVENKKEKMTERKVVTAQKTEKNES